MADAEDPVNRVELRDILQQARRRWRLKLALRGAAAALCAGFAIVLAAALAIEFFKFNPAAIIAFRIVVLAALIALAGWFLVRPLLHRVTDEQVALYLEERHPALDAAVVSAIDPDAGRRGDASRALVRRLIDTAIDYCRRVDAGRDTDRVPVRRYGMVLGAACAAALLFLLAAPAHLRHSASALLNLSRSVEAASPYRIDVKPGSVTVARGADQTITAQLSGFASEQAALFSRKQADGKYEQLPMLRRDDGGFEAMLFDLGGAVDYFVESDGVRSPVFKLDVVDLPYVKRLGLEYVFPEYTGLPTQIVEDGGDVAVLRGTRIRLRALTTIRASGGRILMGDAKSFPLSVDADGALRGAFTVEGDGFYRIELQDAKGKYVAASPQYTIDALTDQTPLISFSAPRRDVTATPIEEVFVEAQADDDFGVRDLQLVYSVNGGAEKSIRLFDGSGKPSREVSAGHTFYLEELGLQAGDFVSYFARVRDNDVVAGPKAAASDLYFVRIRPFRKEFRPAESQAGGGGAAAEPGALSQQQRQIIAGTFNVTRDRKNLSPEKLRESLVVLALAQSRLREQVEELASRMTQRLEGTDPSFGRIAGLLPKAAEEMRAAEAKLQARAPEGALPPEQRALQHLQRAEEEYQLQVSVNRNAGGGGGGGAQPMAEDLADLFDLEMDKMANQYETAQRAEQLEADRQLDEVAEKLKELARRQEQEAERERRRAAAGQGSSGGGASQRALADQTEEMARRLERLAREEERPDLAAAARRLQEAADAMRRAAASGESGEAGQAGSALERLRDAAGRLERERDARAERDIGDALREAEQLAREQGEIARDVNGMERSGAGRQEQMTRLGERKDQLQNRVAELERHLDRTAADIRGNEREAAKKAQEAAAGIRDNKIKEKIRYSRNLMRGGAEDYARALEQDIGENLEALRDTLGEAAAALGQRAGDPTEDALERARQLARGLDSLERRMREGQQGENGRTGANREERGNGEQRAGESGGQQGEPQNEAQRGSQAGDPAGEGSQASGETTGGAQAGGQSSGGPQGGGAPTGGSRRPGNFSPEDIRQFRGEFRRWSAEAQELARALRGQGMNAADVEELLRSLRSLDSDRVFSDPAELQRLQSLVAEGAKRVEFRLRREAGADAAAAALAGSDEVPPEFTKLVEEYYRTLAKARGGSR